MEHGQALDVVWVLLGTVLVLLMQGAFLALESGLTRSKNAINVAMKNAADFVLSLLLWWSIGFGLMFGASTGGLLGGSFFAPDVGRGEPWFVTFFLFQAMFCATAATIVSGAVAERMRFGAYLAATVVTVVLVYPVFGHWAWGGAFTGLSGWLGARGFVDFAGSTVVHGVGGWVALAAVLIVGPRQGRFVDGESRHIPGSNLPLAMLGVLLFVIGWIGFNAGSTLSLTAAVPGIVANTVLAAVAGGASSYLLARLLPAGLIDPPAMTMNGVIAGLVAITAGCHALGTAAALLTGAIGAVCMLGASVLLVRLRIDDALGAVPTHLAAGAWGTLAVGLLADPERLGTGLGRVEQTLVQLEGIVVCGLWSFGVAWLALSLLDRVRPLRVSGPDEERGLNVAEHGAKTELLDLLHAMETQERSQDLSMRVPVEPFTEVGQIALRHNRLMGALERTVTQNRNIIRDMHDGILTWSAAGAVASLNPGAQKIFGCAAAAALGTPVAALFGDPRNGPAFAAGDGPGAVRDLAAARRRELVLRRPGSEADVWVELSVTGSRDGGEPFYTGVVRDVSDRRRVEEQLYRQNERLQVTLESIADGVITTSAAGRIVYMNPIAEKLTHWPLERAEGQRLHTVFPVVDSPADPPDDTLVRAVLETGQARMDERPKLLFSRDGTVHAVKLTAAPMRDAGDAIIGVVVVFHDVTQARSMERKLVHQATHDDLTGLINRREFETRLERILGQVRAAGGGEHAVCYVDLDQFKVVNDTCGHAAGDQLLKEVAAVLGRCLRSADTLARLGGDEFGVILHGCDLAQAARLADKLREAVRAFRFSWNGKQFSVGTSIGLVGINAATASTSALLSEADAACYAAKDMGRNRIHVYEPGDAQLALRRGEMGWVSKIQAALDRDGFRLFRQPIAPATDASPDSGHIEVLVRMVDADTGALVPPGAFLPSAERYNLMVDLDRWVVRHALAWLAEHCYRPEASITCCSINLSGASIGDEAFCRELTELVSRRRIPPRLLCFEITETAAVADLARATRFITDLKRLGCTFALDDFGSGLSSFAYLKSLPVDYLKIDGAFIRDIDSNPIDRAMVESINRVGHVMGLKTIAEFVEDDAVLARLQAIGVDFVQGYHVGRPRPLDDPRQVPGRTAVPGAPLHPRAA